MGKHAPGHKKVGDGGGARAGRDFQHLPARETAVRLVEVPYSPSRARQAQRHDHRCEFALHPSGPLPRLRSFSR